MSIVSGISRILATCLLLSVTAHAQTICEPMFYYHPSSPVITVAKPVPTDWFMVRFSPTHIARIDSAYIGFGIQKTAATAHTNDTLIVKVYDSPFPPATVLDSYVAAIPPNLQGQVPDSYWVIEFEFDGYSATLDPPRDFTIAWKISGPAADQARISLRKPSANAHRSLVLAQTGMPVRATDYFFPSPQPADSVDFNIEARICYPQGVPVELSAFSISMIRGQAQLQWRTDSESGNRGFSIERAQGGSSAKGIRLWQTLGFIPGNGTTTSKHEYAFVDPSPFLAASENGEVLYRLRQEDFDGSYTYGPVQSINVVIPESGTALAPCFPNPARSSDKVRVSFHQTENGFLHLTLVDALGRVQKDLLSDTFAPGSHGLTLSLQDLHPGSYYLVLASGDNRSVRPLIITE